MEANPRQPVSSAAIAAITESSTGFLLPAALILGLVLLLRLNVGGNVELMTSNSQEAWLKFFVGYLGAAAEIVAALVVGIAVIQGLFSYVSNLARRAQAQSDSIESIRLRLGRVLALGLEFTIASDILRTAVAPTSRDIMNLGAIILLRTLLNYFLEREIRNAAT